ncbi:MAG TPA: hypothetical protein VGC89_16715 [Pyrinomonadaceae bacterium]
MKIVHAPLQSICRLLVTCGALALLVCVSISAAAQSTDIEFPTPVRSDEISGTIAPRDVGDSRLTRYFYSLMGAPGDLILTVESRNLNGDVDLFTAGALRPLAKLSMYAGDVSSSSSKTIYFKRDEPLILRIEARSPNDNDGTFRIRFSGAFAPIVGEAREAEPIAPPEAQPATAGRRTKRVTATGARIDEPVLETVEKAPEPQPSRSPAPDVAATEKPADTSRPATNETEATARPAPRPARARRPRSPRSMTPRTARARPAPTIKKDQPPARPEQTPSETTAATAAEASASGPRLIIETRDGLRIERYMTGVRRVTVENGQIVVVLKSGKMERQPMTNVLKMSIEP